MEEALANPYVLKSGGGPSNYHLTGQPDLRACGLRKLETSDDQGRIFVCGFINAAYGFWAIVCC